MTDDSPTMEEVARMAIEDYKNAVKIIEADLARYKRLAAAIVRDATEHGYRGSAFRELAAIVNVGRR